MALITCKNAGIVLLSVFTLQLGRLDPCIFTCVWLLVVLNHTQKCRDRGFCCSWGVFGGLEIVLGFLWASFSSSPVVLRAFGRSLGLLFPPLGGLPGALGGF